MTLLKIAQLGHPILLQVALPIDHPLDDDIQRLIDDMIETMNDTGGVGLAAPQVYRSHRLFVAKRFDQGEDNDSLPPFVILNPVLRPLSDTIDDAFEGCLSIPGLRGKIPRNTEITYSGLDREGYPIEGQATGYFARILQHENDHLDGILYPARMRDWSHMGFATEITHLSKHLQP